MSRSLPWSLLLLVFAAATTWAAEPPPDVPGQRLPMLPDEADKLGYVAGWYQNLDLPDSQHVAEATRLGDLLIVREAPRPLVSAISIDDGALEWQREIGEPDEIYHTPVRDGDRLFFTTPLRLLELNVVNGAVNDRAQFELFVAFPPVRVEHQLIMPGANGLFFAYHVDRTVRLWKRRLPARLLTGVLNQGTTVLVTDAEGNIALYDALSGDQRWNNKAFDAIRAAPAMDENLVYVPSMDQSLYAIDRRSGRERWVYHTETPLDQPVHRLGQYLFLPVPGEGLLALDHETGEEAWRLPGMMRPLLVNDGQLLFRDTTRLTLVQASDGVVITEAASDPLQTVIAGPDSSAVLVTTDGRVQRLNVSR